MDWNQTDWNALEWKKFLGKNNQEYANILKYVSLLNQEGVILGGARLKGK